MWGIDALINEGMMANLCRPLVLDQSFDIVLQLARTLFHQLRSPLLHQIKLLSELGRAQIAALSGGVEVTLIDEKVCERAAEQYQTIDPKRAGGKDWPSCLRLLERLYPTYKD